jgi:hypothetical protein
MAMDVMRPLAAPEAARDRLAVGRALEPYERVANTGTRASTRRAAVNRLVIFGLESLLFIEFSFFLRRF